jgi:uncharacterized membrane protein YgcG
MYHFYNISIFLHSLQAEMEAMAQTEALAATAEISRSAWTSVTWTSSCSTVGPISPAALEVLHPTHDTRHTTHDTRHTTHDTRHTTQTTAHAHGKNGPLKDVSKPCSLLSRHIAGSRGHGGSGGHGGAGGAGGSSYSWTESHTRSNGDGTSSTYARTPRCLSSVMLD